MISAKKNLLKCYNFYNDSRNNNNKKFVRILEHLSHVYDNLGEKINARNTLV